MRIALLIAVGAAAAAAHPALPSLPSAPPATDPANPAAVHGDPAVVPPDWRAPLDPLLLRRPFDPPAADWLAGHRGIDLAGRVGDPVRAVADGTVTWAGPVAGRGVVAVRHGGLTSSYEPLAPSVHVGEQVSAGTVLGRLSGGGHCPACLHLGARTADGYRDPWPLLQRRIRLLPSEPG